MRLKPEQLNTILERGISFEDVVGTESPLEEAFQRSRRKHGRRNRGNRRNEHGSKRSHEQLEKACCEYAWMKHRIRLYKTDAEPVKVGADRYIPRVDAGMPDRIGVLPPYGRLLVVEVKSGKSGLRQAQREVIAQMLASGAVSIIARNISQFADALDMVVKEAQE